MRQIIFVNRYFYPDHSATSRILSDLAFHLASQGHRVGVISSRQSYDNPDAQLPPHQLVHGVDIYRVRTTTFGRASLAGRALDYLSFYFSVWRTIDSIAKPGDILIVKTDPPLLSILGALARRRRKLVLINWLQDLYPEVASELGVPFLKGPVLKVLAAIRTWSLRAAQANVVIGGRMAGLITGAGVETARVHVIANWTDEEIIAPVAHSENPLVREWGLEGKFIVGYSGNLGRAHEYATIVGAAARLRDDERLVFLFIGGGASVEKLQAEVQAQGLQAAFRFLPYQPDGLLRFSLGVPHVHWLSLRPRLEGLIVPSKFYGIAAAGRPVLVIGAPDGELAPLVQSAGCGFAVRPGDSPQLAETIRSLSADPSACEQMGAAARALVEARFSRKQALSRWVTLLQDLDNTTK